jgi:hypothetical protein
MAYLSKGAASCILDGLLLLLLMVVGESGIIADEATTIDAVEGFGEDEDADGCCSAATREDW